MNVITIKDGFILEAEFGMMLKRVSDGQLFGSPLKLGYTYYLNRQKLDEPLKELPEHYEEIPTEMYVAPEEEDVEETVPIEEESVDPTELDLAIRAKVKASNAYAESIKSVSLYGQEVWKTPSERDNYMSTLQSAQRLGMTEISFLGFNMQITDAIRILDMVNVWAFKVTAVKESHERNINALSSIEEVEAYDFTLGYPDKIVIE